MTIDLDARPPISWLSESILLGTPLLRRESCICGGVIEASDSPEAILAAVKTHNATLTHRAWRYTSSLGSTADPNLRDLSASASVRPVGGRQ